VRARNGDCLYFMIFRAGTTNVAYTGWKMRGGVVKWVLAIRGPTGTCSFVYSSASPSPDRWYSVELHWKKGTTDGVGELWVDGVKACSTAGQNTAGYGDVDYVKLGLSASKCGSITAYSDCVKLGTSYIGPE
jgi:hypothetical protein